MTWAAYIGKLHELASVWNLEVFQNRLHPRRPTWNILAIVYNNT